MAAVRAEPDRALRRRVPLRELEVELNDLLDDSDSDIGEVASDFEGEFEASEVDTDESDDETATDNDRATRGSNPAGGGSIVQDGWKRYLRTDNDFPLLPFTVQNTGLQPINPRPNSELDFFQLFFTDELLTSIVSETNRYAAEKIMMNTPMRKNCLWNNWRNVTLAELKAAFGVIMNMALNEKSSIEDYFSEDWLDRQPFFKDVFSRVRFCQIFWMLHLNPPPDQETRGMASRGQKVKNVADYVDMKCREYFIPSKNIAVDESTVGYKGRIVFKCYNPKKPTKWGMRVYFLCDSGTVYMCAFIPYFGTPTTNSLIRPDLPFTSRIVLHLCQTLLLSTNGNGYHVFTDRFYTSYILATELLKMNINLTGTLMANRKGLPIEVKKKRGLNLQMHEVAAFRKIDNILVLAWKDKRMILMLSTVHNPETEVIQRFIRRGEIEDVRKPKVIIDYTANMGGVDRADHYCGSYAFTRKTMKWWRKMFFWLLEVSIVNAFILCNLAKRNNNLPPTTHKRFRRKLIIQLIGTVRNANSRKRGRPSTTDKEERLNGKTHFIAKHENSNKKKDCLVCSNRKIPGGRSETVWFCETCARKPGLHPGDCFKFYHTKEKYRQV